MKINENFIEDKWLSKIISKQVYVYKSFNNLNLDLPKKTQFSYIKINKKDKFIFSYMILVLKFELKSHMYIITSLVK